MGKPRGAKTIRQRPLEAVQMHEAKAQLSRLVKEAAAGKSFLIAIGGELTVRVAAIEPVKPPRRYGFLDGKYEMPDDFKEAYRNEVDDLFYGKA